MISWFLKNKRSFSFREEKTPYRVWVSEVMLQQTRAIVVEEYFKRWMEVFPNVTALAKAESALVIKMWEGLGYYARARNLHLGAKQIVERYKGVFPEEREHLLSIQGIGEYTVGAILSFAFHKKEPAVDGNVLRVIARVKEIDLDIAKPNTKKLITEIIKEILPEEMPWIAMEAFIELGATLCNKKPQCFTCPLKKTCGAYLHDTQDKYPIKSKKEKTIVLERKVYVFESDGFVLLKKEKDQKKIMADLYEFPYIGKEEPAAFSSLLSKTNGRFLKKLSFQTHTFTKYKARLYPEQWVVLTRQDFLGYEWVSKDDLSTLAYSSGHKKILQEYLYL